MGFCCQIHSDLNFHSSLCEYLYARCFLAPFSTASTFGGNCRGRPLPVHVAWPARGRLIGSRKVRGADKLKSVVKTEREKDGKKEEKRKKKEERRKRETD